MKLSNLFQYLYRNRSQSTMDQKDYVTLPQSELINLNQQLQKIKSLVKQESGVELVRQYEIENPSQISEILKQERIDVSRVGQLGGVPVREIQRNQSHLGEIMPVINQLVTGVFVLSFLAILVFPILKIETPEVIITTFSLVIGYMVKAVMQYYEIDREEDSPKE